MLPDRRLPAVPVGAVEGPWSQRGFRWLGLAQPGARNAGLSWSGLTAESVVASGVIFGLAHIGKADVMEVGLSLPGGIAVAYVTLRARSIWPAVIAHLTMNVIPMAMSALFTG